MMEAANFFTFILISINCFVCSTPYKWDLTNSANNVQLFGQFIEEIDKNYDQQERRNITDEKKKLLFYHNFVKYSSEIAFFRVVNGNPEDSCANLVGCGAIAIEFLQDLHYDKSMERHIANEFNKNILCPEEPLPRALVEQLLMFSFTFAARLLLSFEYHFYVSDCDWQIKTLLSAYKTLSSKSDTNGVYSLQIPESISEYTEDQYIDNFKFVLKLSNFSLASFEVYKLLETILNHSKRMDDKSNVRAVEQQPPELYTFLKQYFGEIIGKRPPAWTFLKHFRNLGQPKSKSMDKLLRCELERFGMALLKRANFIFYEFTHYLYSQSSEVCKDVSLGDHNAFIFGARVPGLFNEPLANYSRVIQIDDDQCKEVKQFAETFRKIVVDIEMDSDKNNNYSNKNGLFNSNEFKILVKILNYDWIDKENVEKLIDFKENFERKKAFSKETLTELLTFLDKIIGDYSCTNACKFKWNLWNFGKNIPKFSQMFFKIFEKYSGEVKYDGKDQLMSFPPKLAEHFLQRLYALTENKSASICKIGEELDFVQTIQNVASTDQLKFVRRKKIIPIEINTQFFKLLFSLAFRLSLQIERSNLAGKYLKAFETAYNCIKVQTKIENHSFFKFKINISNEIVEINLPNWKLPDYMQTENINELRQQKVKKNFDFLLSLSNCTPTFYEILKVAKKLGEIELLKDDANGEMNNDDHQNWLISSNSKIIFEIMKYLKPLPKRIKQIKINIENEFCFLAHFVEYLLEEMATGDKIPKIESIEFAIGHFILVKEELCKEKSIENDVKKYFDENLVNFNKALTINIDFSPHNEMRQIISEIVKEIKQILKNGNWNYAHLNFTKIVEWNLLEFNLHKMGNDQKWEEIGQLRDESQKAYSNWYSDKNEGKKLHFEKVIGKLIKVLRGI